MSNITKTQAIKIYKVVNKKIMKLAKCYSISKKDLVKHYYQPSYNLATITEAEIFMRFAQSLQNSGQMSNSIKFDDNYEIIKRVVSDLINGKYKNPKADEKIYNDFTKKYGIVDNGTGKKKKTKWQEYSKGLFTFYQFFGCSNLKQKFKDLAIKPADERLEETIDLANNISESVYSMGFTLACDFLKECGCTWLSKPDTHILEICGTIFGQKTKGQKNRLKKKSPEDYVRDMHNLVFTINKNSKKYKNVTDYQLDKMFWLISSREFYFDTEKLINRDNLCTEIQEIMSAK